MYTIKYDQLPKLVKDVPWFINQHPALGRIRDVDSLVAHKSVILGILEMVYAEPEAVEFVEWLCEHRNVVNIDIPSNNHFIIYIKPKDLPSSVSTPEEFMDKTMPESLKTCFIEANIIPL